MTNKMKNGHNIDEGEGDGDFIETPTPSVAEFDDEEGEGEGIIDIEGSFAPMLFGVSQRRIRDMHNDYTNRELDPRPPFQRGYVWDRTKASRLVESVLMNVPLPLIYTAEEGDGKELVIDGQQRLLSLFGFISGIFPKDKSSAPFRLTKLKLMKNLNGKLYDDLEETTKRKLMTYNIQVIKISADSHPDVKFEIFERLNSGAVKLNAQELRNCVYRGPFNDVLRELSGDENFKKCIGTSNALDRMQDCELILRFLAFYDRTYLKYPENMKSFLNTFMDDNKNLPQDKAEDFRKTFKKSSELSYSVLGTNAFRRFSIGTEQNPAGGHWERTINRALFDVTMWGFSQYEKRQIVPCIDTIKDAYIDLIQSDEKFRDSVTSATGNRGKVRYRFETWQNRLKEIIDVQSQERRIFSKEEKSKLYSSSKMCAICKQEIVEFDDAEVDHRIPYSVGGSTSVENAQLAHRYCNRVKSDKTNKAF